MSEELKKELRDIKKLLVLHLVKNDVGQDDIARVLGVSQPAVSQMLNPKGKKNVQED